MANGACDVAASTLAVRRDGGGSLGRVSAIAYVGVPLSLLVRRGDLPLVATGLCSRRVGVFPGSLEHDILREHADACTGQGRPALRIEPVTSTPVALERLRAGTLDALLDAHPVNSWFARRQTDRYDLAWILGEEEVLWAIGVGRENHELYHAIRVALRGLGGGELRGLLDRWGLDRAGAVLLPTT